MQYAVSTKHMNDYAQVFDIKLDTGLYEQNSTLMVKFHFMHGNVIHKWNVTERKSARKYM